MGNLAGDYSAGVRDSDHRVARTAGELLAIFHEVSHSPEAYDAVVTWGYPQIVDTSRLRGFVLG